MGGGDGGVGVGVVCTGFLLVSLTYRLQDNLVLSTGLII